jgi:RNA polymerase sigma-70 factor, ECF subfamily
LSQVTDFKTRPVASKHAIDFRQHSDGQLINEVLSGRGEFFGELISRHAPFVKRVINSRVVNESDREDILQQTLLKAFRQLAQFRFEAGFRTWLTRIAINEELQLRRTRFCSRLVFNLDSPALTLSLADAKESAYDQCRRSEQCEYLQRSLRVLPEKYRKVLDLWANESLTLAEIAQTLGLGVPAAKSRLHRARIMLRSCWLKGRAGKLGRDATGAMKSADRHAA